MLKETNAVQSSYNVTRLRLDSDVLKTNSAGIDPVRIVDVFHPMFAGNFPVLYHLVPWTQGGRQAFEWKPFRESLYDRLVRLITEGKIPPCVVVSPDLYTWFGGSPYINSTMLGPHADFLVTELIPFIEAKFNVRAGPKARGAFGVSSGGFGALRLAMDYPGTFGAVACHSGDMGFDWLYRHDLIVLANGLRKYGADPLKFIDYCLAAPKLTGFETHLLMILGMAASYSPNPASPTGFDLPLDLKTGLMNEDVWAKWLSHDPVHRIAQGAEGLAKLKTLFVDCGSRDQYNLQYGARQFAAKLQSKGIKHIYEEFDDDHSGLQYRFDRSLPILLEGLQT
jgi:hypothetical protein